MGMIGFGYGYDGMPGAYGGTGYGIPPLWGIGMMLVFLVVFLGIGYILYRTLVRGKHAFAAKEPALEELRMAYARGELTQEEFEERRKTLSGESNQSE